LHPVPISKAALKAYPLNNLNGKTVNLKLIACPVLFTGEKLIGAWIYEQKKRKVKEEFCIEKIMLHWFESNLNSAGSGRVI
jgi:hypothetical protein